MKKLATAALAALAISACGTPIKGELESHGHAEAFTFSQEFLTLLEENAFSNNEVVLAHPEYERFMQQDIDIINETDGIRITVNGQAFGFVPVDAEVMQSLEKDPNAKRSSFCEILYTACNNLCCVCAFVAGGWGCAL